MINPMDDLKPCPFCASLLVALVGMVVRCGKCGATGPYGITREDAVSRWNVRAEPEPGVSDLQAVEPEHKAPSD